MFWHVRRLKSMCKKMHECKTTKLFLAAVNWYVEIFDKSPRAIAIHCRKEMFLGKSKYYLLTRKKV